MPYFVCVCVCVGGSILHGGRIYVITDPCFGGVVTSSGAAEDLRPTFGADLRPRHSGSAGPRSNSGGTRTGTFSASTDSLAGCFKYAAGIQQKSRRHKITSREEKHVS